MSAAIDPRVADQMRLLKERTASEEAARAAEREALARQLEESKITWEAELRIEMEGVPLTLANVAFIQGLASMGCTSSSTAPLRAGSKVPASHLANICPYGVGGRWGHNNHICTCPKAPRGFTSWLEREKHSFRASWLRREYELIAAGGARSVAPVLAVHGPVEAPVVAAAPAPVLAVHVPEEAPAPRMALNVAEVAPVPVICVPEEAPAPRMALNVAEVAPTDAERIVALERRVALLTEAVVSLLEMKSRGEHDALTRQEEALSSFPLRTGQHVNLWGPKATIYMPCDYMVGTSDKSVCEAAVTALQTATVKTDSLLTALGHSA